MGTDMKWNGILSVILKQVLGTVLIPSTGAQPYLQLPPIECSVVGSLNGLPVRVGITMTS
jgi:hypothetical protein